MEIQKCSDFIINEAKTDKKDTTSDILDMFTKKPNVEMKSLSNERGGLYSVSGLKSYLSGKYTSANVDGAFHDIINDKSSGLKHIYVKVTSWNESIPYYYIGLTDVQAKKLKAEYEAEEYEKNKEQIVKKEIATKASKAAAVAKTEIKKEVTAKKAAAKKTTKPVEKGVERKPGGVIKRKSIAPKKK